MTLGWTVSASRLPHEAMHSSGVPLPKVEDALLVMRLDPNREECWEPVTTELLSGWKFRLVPLPGGEVFSFLAFRSPSDGNLYRIWPISPNVDHLFGHGAHMISVTIGGEKIPVICGPGGRPAPDLATARLYATKWALYWALRLKGLKPGFSE